MGSNRSSSGCSAGSRGCKGMVLDVEYCSKPTIELSDDELEQCSSLYSNHYGFYSSDAPDDKPGKRIRMTSRYYRNHFMNEGYCVVLAKHQGSIIGQAFYLRDRIDDDVFTWVLQLVVHTDYRRFGIGSKMLIRYGVSQMIVHRGWPQRTHLR